MSFGPTGWNVASAGAFGFLGFLLIGFGLFVLGAGDFTGWYVVGAGLALACLMVRLGTGHVVVRDQTITVRWLRSRQFERPDILDVVDQAHTPIVTAWGGYNAAAPCLHLRGGRKVRLLPLVHPSRHREALVGRECQWVDILRGDPRRA